MAASGPWVLVGAAGTIIVLFLCLAYLPFVSRVTLFTHPWECVGLALVGAALTHVAWRHGCRGPVGSVATLLDNTFYSSALALAAMTTQTTVGVALALVHGMVIASATAQLYALSFVLAVTMVTPLAILLLVFRPALPVALIVIGSTILMLVISEITRSRRSAKRRQTQLEQALGAADRLADESVQAALTTTLLTLGHFLHELRNYQTAISLSLEFIESKATLDPPVAQALEEAQSAQRRQQALLNEVVNDLRGRAQPSENTFLLAQAVRDSVVQTRGVDIVINKADVEFQVLGNPEHLRIVLLNLIRNAEQAGAKTVSIVWRPDPSGHAVQMIVHDDGQGIPEADRGKLFASFARSDKQGGTGLGLYLVRRYIQVLGGQVRIETGPMGGAAFVIRLPGIVGPRADILTPAAAQVPQATP